MRQITDTTDNQFIGEVFDETKPIYFNGVLFEPEKIETLEGGIIRYSNANYIVETREWP